jgi:hypothetical protein
MLSDRERPFAQRDAYLQRVHAYIKADDKMDHHPSKSPRTNGWINSPVMWKLWMDPSRQMMRRVLDKHYYGLKSPCNSAWPGVTTPRVKWILILTRFEIKKTIMSVHVRKDCTWSLIIFIFLFKKRWKIWWGSAARPDPRSMRSLCRLSRTPYHRFTWVILMSIATLLTYSAWAFR